MCIPSVLLIWFEKICFCVIRKKLENDFCFILLLLLFFFFGGGSLLLSFVVLSNFIVLSFL